MPWFSCERKMADFWIPTELYSGSDGSFRLRGVADGDTIRLSARSADMATERATSLTVSSTVQPELILVPQIAVQLCGQVVDNSRAPVAGATVTVTKKVVIREEGNNFEFSQAEDLLPDGSFVRTDAQGQFCFPASIDWQDTLRIQITRHGYTSFCTPWLDGRKLPVEDGRVQLDAVLPAPPPRDDPDRRVSRRRRDGRGGGRCEGRLPGARTGKAAGITDEQGRLSLEVKNERQLVAVEQEGYQHLFQGLASVDKSVRLELRQRTTVASVPRDSVTRFTVPQLQNVGRQLLDSVPAPRGGEATENRCTLYFRSLADRRASRSNTDSVRSRC